MSHRARKALSFVAAAAIALLAIAALVIFNPQAGDTNSQPSDPALSSPPTSPANGPSLSRLPKAKPTPKPVPVQASPASPAATDPPDGTTVGHLPDGTALQLYTVRHGDNLSFIAWKFQTQADKLYTWSRGVIGDNPNLIFAGQKLVV